ncbi:MAG: hypothetical protein K2K16_11735 [Ruminococcus sp.]|nr:hypothetical protein [Ruminococcus sp.]
MTGTGTQNDPYIVDNWTDFMAINTDSASVYVRWADTENKIIDFNDIRPDGFSESVNISGNVDFNGWTLRNFHSTADYSLNLSSNTTIENLIFENFYINSSRLFYSNSLLKNCIISGMIQHNSNSNIFSGCGLLNCSLNIKANCEKFELANGNGFLSPKTQIVNSDIVLDAVCRSSSSNLIDLCTGAIKNSRISGKIQSNASAVVLGNSSSMSNVFNLISNKPIKYTGYSISVFNSDIAEKSSDSRESFIGVTSEQLKNAEYLYNIGFPIGIE